jgi:short-subunit dehydrogenase involved in D-alanine esterification of teichoic acids
MENVTECVEYIIKKYPGFNIYINNEEICINEAGQGKILLFDLINNEVKTNNEAYEIVTIFNTIPPLIVAKFLRVAKDSLESCIITSKC